VLVLVLVLLVLVLLLWAASDPHEAAPATCGTVCAQECGSDMASL
jgi:hypothetical protein